MLERIKLAWTHRGTWFLPKTRAKLAERIMIWRLRRKWARMAPHEQLVAFAQVLDESPHMRTLFRRCLRVKGLEELSAPPLVTRPGRIVRPGQGPRPRM